MKISIYILLILGLTAACKKEQRESITNWYCSMQAGQDKLVINQEDNRNNAALSPEKFVSVGEGLPQRLDIGLGWYGRNALTINIDSLAGTGIYTFGPNHRGPRVYYTKGNETFTTDSLHTGSVIISAMDTVSSEKYIEGKFHFSLANSNGLPFEVKEGYFKFRL